MPSKYYLKAFKNTLRFLEYFAALFPFIGNFLLKQTSPVIIPPIENHVLAIYALLIISLVFTLHFLKDLKILEKQWVCPVIMFVLFLLSFVAFLVYDCWSEKTIRTISIIPLKKNISVIVGLERSPFAKEHFANNTDEEMLKERGYTKEEIRRLWTPESIIRARCFVIGSYFLLLLFITMLFGIGTLKLALEEQRVATG